MKNMKNLEKPNFAKMGGLLPAIVQDAATGDVLMLAFMNEAAWDATLKTGEAHIAALAIPCGTRAALPGTCSGFKRSTWIAITTRCS
jgi:hypothetical protein